MKSFLKILIFIICLNETVQGQTSENSVLDSVNHIYIGANFGYMNVLQRNIRYQFIYENSFKEIQGANGNGFSFGLNLKYSILREYIQNQYLLFGLTLDNSNTKNILVYDEEPKLKADPNNPTGWYIETTSESFETEIFLSYIVATLQYSVKISNTVPLNITAGPTIALLVDNNFKQTYQWEITGNKRDSLNKNFKTIVYDNSIQNTKKIIPGIQFGLSYEINIGEKIQVLPEVNYQLYLITIVNNHSWNIANLKAGISFMYAID